MGEQVIDTAQVLHKDLTHNQLMNLVIDVLSLDPETNTLHASFSNF